MRKQTIQMWAILALSLGLTGIGFSSRALANETQTQAVDALLLQARQGQVVAQRELGKQLFKGQSRPKDLGLAFYWLKLAAEQGDANAQNYLGFIYDTGQGAPENKALAFKWYQLAAQQKDPQAQFNLASLYHLGEGVAQSHILAASWYKLAAQKGHADAQMQIATFFHAGQGVEKDLKQALYWYRTAAAQGHQLAQEQAQVMEAYLNQSPLSASTKASLQAYQDILRQSQLLALKIPLKNSLSSMLQADPGLGQKRVWSNLEQELSIGYQRGYTLAEINQLGARLNQVIEAANQQARIEASPLFKNVAAQVFYNQAVYADLKSLKGANLNALHKNYEQTAMNDISMQALKPLFIPTNQSRFQDVCKYLKQKESRLSPEKLNKQALRVFLIDAPEHIPGPLFDSLYQEIEVSYRHFNQLQALAK